MQATVSQAAPSMQFGEISPVVTKPSAPYDGKRHFC